MCFKLAHCVSEQTLTCTLLSEQAQLSRVCPMWVSCVSKLAHTDMHAALRASATTRLPGPRTRGGRSAARSCQSPRTRRGIIFCFILSQQKIRNKKNRGGGINESPFFSLASSFLFFFWATRQRCYVNNIASPPLVLTWGKKKRCYEATSAPSRQHLPHRITTPRPIEVLFCFLQRCYVCAGGLPSVPQV